MSEKIRCFQGDSFEDGGLGKGVKVDTHSNNHQDDTEDTWHTQLDQCGQWISNFTFVVLPQQQIDSGQGIHFDAQS